MKRMGLVLVMILALLSAATAQQSGGSDALPKGFKTTPVIKTTMTASHGKITYPTGQAEVISVIGELEPGGRTPRHQHPVPVMVYVLEGTLTIQADGAEAREYKPGQAFMEDVNHWHQAFNKTSQPVKLLVVFMGEEGKPTTVNAQ
jgi:quercetin dioxygenase-like cupin family protein